MPNQFTSRKFEYLQTPAAIRTRAKYKTRLDAGLCRDCGKNKPIKNRVACKRCFALRIVRGKRYKALQIKKGLCCNCGAKNTRKGSYICKNCSIKIVEKYRQKRKENKEFIVKYFGDKCLHCGEKDIRCLGLDHVNGDGSIDKRSDTGKKQLTPAWYAKLIKLIKAKKKLPRKLQLLCHNCHAKKDLIPWWFEND